MQTPTTRERIDWLNGFLWSHIDLWTSLGTHTTRSTPEGQVLLQLLRKWDDVWPEWSHRYAIVSVHGDHDEDVEKYLFDPTAGKLIELRSFAVNNGIPVPQHPDWPTSSQPKVGTMNTQEIEAFGRNFCQVRVECTPGGGCELVACCNLAGPDGLPHRFERRVDVGPILEWVEARLRKLHTQWHTQGTEVAGLGSFYRKAVRSARLLAQSKAFRELASDALFVLAPAPALAAGEAKKASEVVADAKKGDPGAKAKVATIKGMAEAGDPKAQATIKTMAVMSKMQDQKFSETEHDDFYSRGVAIHEDGKGVSIGHSPVAWVGAAQVRDNRKGAPSKKDQASTQYDQTRNTGARAIADAHGAARNVNRPVYAKATNVNIAPTPQMMPTPPGYPGYPGVPGMPNPYDPYGMGAYGNPYDPTGGLGLGFGMPPMTPGMYPYSGFGMPSPSGMYSLPPPVGMSPLGLSPLDLELLDPNNPLSQGNQRTYDPNTDSFYSNEVKQVYDPNTDSFAPAIPTNPYSATNPYAGTPLAPYGNIGVMGVGCDIDQGSELDARIAGWALGRGRSQGNRGIPSLYSEGLR